MSVQKLKCQREGWIVANSLFITVCCLSFFCVDCLFVNLDNHKIPSAVDLNSNRVTDLYKSAATGKTL